MGRQFVIDRINKANVGLTHLWTKAHLGRFWKRQMNKARRRAWKQNSVEGKPNNKYESYCQYKGW